MYSGKEVCQGCKKPGSEVQRVSKNDLCRNCSDVLDLGKAELTHTSIEYVATSQMMFAYYDSIVPFGKDEDKNRLNVLIRDVLKALDNPTAKIVEHGVSLKSAFGDNCYRYTVPKGVIEPLKEFALFLEKHIKYIREEREKIPKEAKEAVQEEKDRIFNEGLEKGRELLFSLNNGEVTMDEFSKRLRYNGR